MNLHPDIWLALSEDAKSQLAAARREFVRKAKAVTLKGIALKIIRILPLPIL